MRRSYFIPILLLGSVILVTGLYGLRAFRIALEHYDAQSHHYVRRAVEKVDSETLLKSLGSEHALRCRNMRLHALSATFVGLVFIVWAFDRRSVYARLKAAEPGQTVGSLVKAKMQIRSIAFCGLLLLFAAGAVVHMREIVPEWVHHMRMRSDRKRTERVRAFLEDNGIPGAQVYWGGGKGGKSITLAGPEVNDISPLAELPVTLLDLCNTQVTDLQPLTQMAKLQRVRLSREQIMGNLEVLRNLHLTVQEDANGPAFVTGSFGWHREYEGVDASSFQRP